MIEPSVLRQLVGERLTALGRVQLVGDGEVSPMMSTLVFVTDRSALELLVDQVRRSLVEIALDHPIPEFDLEPGETCRVQLIESGLALPARITGITEWWGRKPASDFFLVAAMLATGGGEVRMCLEGDDAEILPEDVFTQLLADLKSDYEISERVALTAR